MAVADDGLRRRVAWVTGIRLVVLSAFLAATTLLYLRGKLADYPVSRQLVLETIGVAYAFAGVQAAVLRRGRYLRGITFVQLVVDQGLWTAIVFVTGGASSGATSFYGLTVLVAAILVGLRGAVFAAVVGLAMYGALCAGFATQLLLPPSDQLGTGIVRSVADISYPALVNALGILLVLLLAGYLAERLRAAGGALELAKQRYTEAEQLAELGRIAAWLAHEVRNPLGSISGSIELLRESPALSAVDRQLCDIVLRESSRLNDLVGDIIDLSRPRKAQAESVDLAVLAREVVALANRSAAAKSGVRVRYVGPDADVRVRCDGAQIRQVAWNLVRNAMQSSAVESDVTVRVQTTEGEATLVVDDEGPGLDEATRERIFDAFYTTRSHGTGIGLAVVKRVIDDHARFGASIRAESNADGGASFCVTLSRDVAGLRPSVLPQVPRLA